MLKSFELKILTTHSLRTIRVYDPETCNEERPCDVLFMHDAQNLFDDEMSYHEVSWRVIEGLEKANVRNIIVVGIDNSPTERMNEYSPYETNIELKNRFIKGTGGKGFIYIDFIVDDVLPVIKNRYHTSENYYMAGSSMGAYISMFAAMRYPSLFKGIGCFSISSWFNEDKFLNDLKASTFHPDTSFFISVGDQETSSDDLKDFPEIYINNSKHVFEVLENKGIKRVSFQVVNGKHNERQWMNLFPEFIKFMIQPS
jgi:predicted alpha/beta superfamily hydrolase